MVSHVSATDSLRNERIWQDVLAKRPPFGDTMHIEEYFYPADTEVPDHTHKAEQIGYMLEGTMGLTVEGRSYDVQPGDFYWLPASSSHRLTIGTDVRTLLITAAPFSAEEH